MATAQPDNRVRVHADGGQLLVDDELSWDEVPTTTIEDAPYQRHFGTDEFYVLDYVVARPMVQEYVLGDELVSLRKTAEELKDAQWQIENLPYTITHPEGRTVTDTSDIHGFWANPEYVEGEGQRAQLFVPVTDEEATSFIEENPNVSIGFNPTIDWEVDDEEADGVPRDWVYDHIASVKKGRCSVEDGCGWDGALADGAIYHDGVQTINTEDGLVVECPACGHEMTLDGNGEWKEDADTDHRVDAKFSQGDWATWTWEGATWTWDGTTVYGRVSSVYTDGTVSVGGESRNGTTEEPVYKLRHWTDGGWGDVVVKSESELNKATAPPDFTDDDICTAGPCACGRHVAECGDECDCNDETTMTDDSAFTLDSIAQVNKHVVLDEHEEIAALIDEKDDRISELESKVEDLTDAKESAEDRVEELEARLTDDISERFDETVERLCDAVERYDEDDLRETFEEADSLREKEALVDDIEEKLTLIDEVVDTDEEDDPEANGIVDDDGTEDGEDGPVVDVNYSPDGTADLRSYSD